MSEREQFAKTKCPCGMELVFPVLKPRSRFEKTVSKVSCKSCDSQFLLHVEIKKTPPIKVDKSRPMSREELMALDRPFERQYTSTFEVIRVTAEAAKRAKNPLSRVANMVVEKVSEKSEPKF